MSMTWADLMDNIQGAMNEDDEDPHERNYDYDPNEVARQQAGSPHKKVDWGKLFSNAQNSAPGTYGGNAPTLEQNAGAGAGKLLGNLLKLI